MVLPLNIPQIDSFSDEELTSLCLANPELNIERDENGQIFINMSPTYALTSLNNSELNTEVSLWNRRMRAGKVFDSNSAFILPDTSMRGPDVAWVQKERWDKLSLKEKKSFPKLVPDFVVELASDTDLLDDVKNKMGKWIKNGVRLAWLVNPKEQLTYVYQKGSKVVREVSFDETLNGGQVLVGFEVKLSEILEY